MNNPPAILIVDDEQYILSSTARLLRSAGYAVSEVETGAACLSSVREKRPDLVLLDVHLPGMNGYEVCRLIKADEDMRHTHIVMVSGKLTTSDNQSEGLEIGADSYLVRPISNRELLAHIQATIRIIRAEHERDLLIAKLQDALSTIKTLSGMLPICANCKKIRDDKGYWEEVELYVKRHSSAEFTHGICPECEEKLYGDLNDEETEG